VLFAVPSILLSNQNYHQSCEKLRRRHPREGARNPRQVHRPVSWCPPTPIVMTVMSLSPLLVATSSVENAVFSQYSSNNAPLWRGGGEEGGWTDVSGLSQPGGKRYRYTADPHTWTEGRRVQLPRPSIVGPLLLKAAFCRPLILFLSSTRKRGGSSTPRSQPTLFIAFPVHRA